MNYQLIGGRLKDAREDAEMSLRDVATALHLKDEEIVRVWEKGRSITLKRIEQLARLYRVGEEFLLFAIRRGEQIKSELPKTYRLSNDEAALVSTYRTIARKQRGTVLETVKAMAVAYPEPIAPVIPLRGKRRK